MTIEFHTPHGEISEDTIHFLKCNLMSCYQRDPEISRAEVYFRKNSNDPVNASICEVALTVYGNSLIVHRTAPDYHAAAEEVILEVNRKVDEWISNQNEPPDQVTSTVRV